MVATRDNNSFVVLCVCLIARRKVFVGVCVVSFCFASLLCFVLVWLLKDQKQKQKKEILNKTART